MSKQFAFVSAMALAMLVFFAPRGAAADDVLSVMMDSEVTDLNPNTQLAIGEARVIDHVYAPLIAVDDRGGILPSLAVEWQISEDRTRYLFRLHEDAAWSDGTPITPEQVVRFFNDLEADPDGKGGESFDAVEITQVTHEGRDWISFQLADAHAIFLFELATVRITPRHIESIDFSMPWTDALPGDLIYSGAYQIEAVSDEMVSLRPNPYWVQRNELRNDGLDIHRQYLDHNEILRSLQARRLDVVLGFLSRSEPVAVGQLGYTSRRAPDLVTMMIDFNTASGPMADARLRRALALAADFTQLGEMEAVLPEALQPGFLSAQSERAFTSMRPDWMEWPMQERLAEAQAIMAELGYSAENPLELTFLTWVEPPYNLFSLLRSQWARVHVTLTLESKRLPEQIDQMLAGDFHVAELGWVAAFAHPIDILNAFSADSPYNTTGYANETFDAYRRELLTATSFEATEAASLAAQAELWRDIPSLPVPPPVLFYVYDSELDIEPRPGVSGIDLSLIGPRSSP